MKRKTSLALVLALCLVLCTFATALAEMPVIRLGYTGGDLEEQAYRASIEGVEEALGCTVEMVRFAGMNTMWEQIPMQVASNSAPDIVAVTNERYMEFIENGLFMDISPYVTKENYDFDKVSSVHKNWVIDGKIYAIPQDGAPAALIINMDMWNEAGLGARPTTWDEVKEAAKVLTKGDVKGIITNDNEFHITQYALSFGGGWNNGATINSPENVKALQFFIDLYKEGLSVTPKELGLGWDGEVFCKGLGAMSTGGVWYTSTIDEMAPDINYEIVAIPSGDGKKGCTSHSDATAVLTSTANPELASKVAIYMGRPEAQQAIADLYGNPPAYTELQAEFFGKNEKIQNLIPAMEYAQPFGYPVETKRFTDALFLELDEALYVKDSTKTAQEILDSVQAQFQ